jgi:hypothetical protein
VRMAQRRDEPGLAVETLPELWLAGELGRQILTATIRSRRVSRAR